jgi:hypothetical protein
MPARDYLDHIQACKEVFVTKGWFLSIIIGGVISVASLAYSLGVSVSTNNEFKIQTTEKIIAHNLRISHIEASFPDLDTIKTEIRKLNKTLSKD